MKKGFAFKGFVIKRCSLKTCAALALAILFLTWPANLLNRAQAQTDNPSAQAERALDAMFGTDGRVTTDFFGGTITGDPTIPDASVKGKTLTINGNGFRTGSSQMLSAAEPQASGPVIMINGEDQKTKPDEQNPSTTLIAPKSGKKIKPGQTVTLQVRMPDGTLSNEFQFTRPQ